MISVKGIQEHKMKKKQLQRKTSMIDHVSEKVGHSVTKGQALWSDSGSGKAGGGARGALCKHHAVGP